MSDLIILITNNNKIIWYVGNQQDFVLANKYILCLHVVHNFAINITPINTKSMWNVQNNDKIPNNIYSVLTIKYVPMVLAIN